MLDVNRLLLLTCQRCSSRNPQIMSIVVPSVNVQSCNISSPERSVSHDTRNFKPETPYIRWTKHKRKSK